MTSTRHSRLDLVDQPGHAGDLGIEPVGRAGRARRIPPSPAGDVFRRDLLRLVAHPALEPAPRRALRVAIAGFARPRSGARNPPVGNFASIGSSGRGIAAHRHDHGEFHQLVAVRRAACGWSRRRPAGRMSSSNTRELGLAPAAARLHVGEERLDVADLRGDRLHVAHRLLHGGELVDHALEARLHLLLDGCVQLLVDGLLDLGEAERAGFGDLPQLGLEQRARLALLAHEREVHPFEPRGDGALARGEMVPRGLRLGAGAGQPLLGEQAQALAVARAGPQQQHEQENDAGDAAGGGDEEKEEFRRHGAEVRRGHESPPRAKPALARPRSPGRQSRISRCGKCFSRR